MRSWLCVCFFAGVFVCVFLSLFHCVCFFICVLLSWLYSLHVHLVCHKSEIKNPVYFYPGVFHFILLCSVLAPSDSSSFCLLSACPFVSLWSLVLLSFFIFSRVFLVCSYPGVFLSSTRCSHCFNKVRCLCFLVDGPHAQLCLFVRWGWCAIVKPGSWGFLGSDVFSFVNPGSWGFVGSGILVRGLYEMVWAHCHTRAHGSCPDSSQKKARVLIPKRAPGICH